MGQRRVNGRGAVRRSVTFASVRLCPYGHVAEIVQTHEQLDEASESAAERRLERVNEPERHLVLFDLNARVRRAPTRLLELVAVNHSPTGKIININN